MAKASQATWGGRFSAGPAELMLRFSESVSFDHRLAPFDIAGSKAHSAMLALNMPTKRWKLWKTCAPIPWKMLSLNSNQVRSRN